jgi:hypothetical protein
MDTNYPEAVQKVQKKSLQQKQQMIQLRYEKKRSRTYIQTLCNESSSTAATELRRNYPGNPSRTDSK